MRYEANRHLGRDAVRARACVQALALRARQLVPVVEAGTRRRTGETADSTHVETGHMSASGDRPAVRVVQRNVSTPLNFRTDRDYIVRSVANGL